MISREGGERWVKFTGVDVTDHQGRGSWDILEWEQMRACLTGKE